MNQRSPVRMSAALGLTFVCVTAVVSPTLAWAPGGDPGTLFATTDGDQVVFEAEDEIHGTEFWISDGTFTGTHLLEDFAPGIDDLGISRETRVGDLLFFAGSPTETGVELYTIDLTTHAISLVKDIVPGPDGSSLNYFTAVGDTLYFVAGTPAEGQEIWRSDGTEAGTEMVLSLVPGADDANPYPLEPLGDLLFFRHTIAGDTEVGVLDTSDDSYSFLDINAGGDSYPTNFMAFDGWMYFQADDGAGAELWRSDGTVAQQVADLNGVSASFPTPLGTMGDRLYVRVSASGIGSELHWTTGVGLTLVKDINSGPGHGSPTFWETADGFAYFRATSATDGSELWRTDGTAVGTTQVADINPDGESSSPGSITPLASGRVLFDADDGTHGVELWTTDGTPAGTEMLADLNPGVADASAGDTTPFKDGVLLELSRDRLDGDELWFTDGTTAGTRQVRDLNVGHVTTGQIPLQLDDGRLVFTQWSPEYGEEPWISDGTPEGTRLIADITPGPLGSDVFLEGTLNNLALLSVDTADEGREPWVTDGTAAGTMLLEDIWAGPEDSGVFGFTQLGDKSIFNAEDPAVGEELWITDGTPAGTMLLKDIDPGGDGDPRGFARAGNHVYFRAETAAEGAELWRTDGTPGGTVLVEDIRAGGSGSNPGSITPFGTNVVFRAFTAGFNTEPWISDGTPAGTQMIKDVNTDPGKSSSPSDFTVVGTHMYFSAYTPTEGRELWRTDGTGAGTVLVDDLNAGVPDSDPDRLAALDDDNLFFTATTPAAGTELFTATLGNGASLVTDLTPGDESTVFHELTTGFGGVVFAAAGPSGGHELWFTDGTGAGTELLVDLRPGPASGSPLHLMPGSLWFSGWSDVTQARELYRMEDADSLPQRLTGPAPFVDRVAGPTRIETAVAASHLTYPNGANTVVVARANNYPDSLAGGPLATYLDAPILLTSSTTLSDATKTEIERLGATTAVVLGGTAAVAQSVVDEIVADTPVTGAVRYAGTDRFETAEKIAEAFPNDGTVYVTEGRNSDSARGWPDAVSVSGLAAMQQRPILLVTRDALPDATKDALQGMSRAVLVGGTAAISAAVEGAIDDVVATTSRIAGADRYATSAKVAEAAVTANANDRIVFLATGRNFPDALVAGPAVAAANGVLLLVHPSDIAKSATTRSWLDDRAGTLEVVQIMGGTGAVGQAVEDYAETKLG